MVVDVESRHDLRHVDIRARLLIFLLSAEALLLKLVLRLNFISEEVLPLWV